MSKDTAQTVVNTPECVLSYPNLDKPRQGTDSSGKPKGDPKYSGAFIFAPGSDRAAMDAGIIAAAQKKWPNGVKKGQKTYTVAEAIEKEVLTLPFHSGTDAEEKGYPEGSFFFNARSGNQPGFVFGWNGPDGKLAKVPQDKIKDTFYPGCHVRAVVSFYGYDVEGNMGVGVGLNHVQWVGDGPRLDGRAPAESSFDAVLSAPVVDISAAIG